MAESSSAAVRTPVLTLGCIFDVFRLAGTSRISALGMALALSAVVLLLLVFILETASVLTSATSPLTGTCRWGRTPAGAVLGMLLGVVAGSSAWRSDRPQLAEMARSDSKRGAAQS